VSRLALRDWDAYSGSVITSMEHERTRNGTGLDHEKLTANARWPFDLLRSTVARDPVFEVIHDPAERRLTSGPKLS